MPLNKSRRNEKYFSKYDGLKDSTTLLSVSRLSQSICWSYVPVLCLYECEEKETNQKDVRDKLRI
jgi:hypothetical protein